MKHEWTYRLQRGPSLHEEPRGNPSRCEEQYSRSAQPQALGQGVDNRDPGITRSEFQVQLKEIEVRAERRRGTGIVVGVAKSLKFDGTTLWAVLWRQFKTVETQLLDVSGKINVLEHRLVGLGHRHATRSPERRDIRRNP